MNAVWGAGLQDFKSGDGWCRSSYFLATRLTKSHASVCSELLLHDARGQIQ